MMLSNTKEDVREAHHLDYCLGSIAWALYLLALGARYQSEVVLSPANILQSIRHLRQHATLDNESATRLSIIEGIFQLYSVEEEVQGFSILPMASKYSVLERIDEIIEDAWLLDASRLRRLFSVTANRVALRRDLNKVTRFICKHRSWAQGILSTATQSVLLGSQPLSILEKLVRLLPDVELGNYCPIVLVPEKMPGLWTVEVHKVMPCGEGIIMSDNLEEIRIIYYPKGANSRGGCATSAPARGKGPREQGGSR